jgi:hypothetical protein
MDPLVPILLVYMAFLTLFTVGLIHSYEDKLKKLNQAVEYEKKAWAYEADRVEELTLSEAYWARMYDEMQSRYSTLLAQHEGRQ